MIKLLKETYAFIKQDIYEMKFIMTLKILNIDNIYESGMF